MKMLICQIKAYPELKQYVYYAYPSDYDSGCQLDFNSLLSINTKSEQKAGAWAFLSYLLSEAYQQSMNYLPVSDTVLSYCTRMRDFIDRIKIRAEALLPG